MTIAFVYESDVVDQDGYDNLMKAQGRDDPAAPAPDGQIAHLAGPKPAGGWRVIDVWESEQAAGTYYASDRFAAVRDGASAAGITRSTWPLHRIERSVAASTAS